MSPDRAVERPDAVGDFGTAGGQRGVRSPGGTRFWGERGQPALWCASAGPRDGGRVMSASRCHSGDLDPKRLQQQYHVERQDHDRPRNGHHICQPPVRECAHNVLAPREQD
jgi:hypothetical protein